MKALAWASILFLLCSGLYGQDGGNRTAAHITSDPAGCWVRVDSLLIGKTPLQNLPLAPGRHRVHVYPPSTGIWNLQEKVYEFVLESGKTWEINAVFSKPVLINSIPYNAELFQDTLLIGVTPLHLPFAEYAGKRLELRKPGYLTHRFSLDEALPLLAKLQKDQDFVEEQAKPELLGIAPHRHVKSKFSLLALSVASHWAAFHFKNLADSNFDKYSTAGDPAARNDYWNKTRRYDRVSEISLGISYASLAGLIYMVIRK